MNLHDVLHKFSKSTFTRVFLIILIVLFASFHLPTSNAFAAQATLKWNAPTNPDGTLVTGLGGYKVYYGTTAGSYSQNIDVGNVTSYTVASLADSTTYYFAVMDYATAGTYSGFSNQASYTTPAPPPSSALYTLTASAGSGGSITPSGAVVISQGTSQTFTITPATGYKIAGVTVDGASVGAVSTYIFSNIAANHTIAATFAAAATSSGVSSVVFATNSGGSQYTSSSTGVTYLADAKYSGGSSGTTTATISGTADSSLYQSERYGNFSYSIPVANGNYAVTLKFAEIYFSAAGQRVFSIAVNGQTVISSLDLYAKVGKNAAYDIVVPVSVTNGAINVSFISQVNYAKVSAIKVVPAAPTASTAGTVVFAANSGGSKYTSSSTGVTYLADAKYSGGSGGTTTATINGTADGSMYQSERYGNFSYSIPAANGNYTVTLKFAEIYFSAPGQRVFSVVVNGQTVISNLDLYAKVGKNAAYDVVIPVSVTNGAINVSFISQVNYAKINAILVKTN